MATAGVSLISDAASSAIQFVGSALGAQRFATIDPEEFYDFQATRPRVKMVDGQAREIVWPAVELYEARVPGAPRDLVLVSGTEPSLKWRTFTQVIVELAEDKKAADIVLLDLTGLTTVADHFVICSGGSERQIQAIADGVVDALRTEGVRPIGYLEDPRGAKIESLAILPMSARGRRRRSSGSSSGRRRPVV